MGPLEEFLGWTIKRELTNMTLNFSQSELISKNDSITIFNTPTTSHKEILCQQETELFCNNLHWYWSGI